MSLHTAIDNFESKTPRQKVARVLIGLVLVLAVVLGIAYAGHKLLQARADSEYLKQRDQALAEVAVLKASAGQHEQNEAKLAKENEFLKKQNEAQAEAFAQADTDRERKAVAAQAQLDAERAKAFADIDADTDYNSQIQATCADYARRGFKLSFCDRFKETQ
jgi:uncharacterized protein HemX